MKTDTVSKSSRPSRKFRWLMAFYRGLWFFLMPIVLGYLWVRGRKEPDYFRHLSERFGRHKNRAGQHVWIHTVSIGEARSAEPIIRKLLEMDQSVVVTTFTPAGRSALKSLFGDQIDVVWVPFDYGLAIKRFFQAFKPKFGLLMEVEIWPGMIVTAQKSNVPLFCCNCIYSEKSFEKDKRSIASRRELIPMLAGAMVKTQEYADRFAEFGLKRVAVTGEMRFDQRPSAAHLKAAEEIKTRLKSRPVITLSSIVKDEEDLIISALKTLSKTPSNDRPLVVFVPRAKERFPVVYDKLSDAGFRVSKRTDLMSPQLEPKPNADLTECDVLIGDSYGEMFFYLALASKVLIGGGYTVAGSHNIIEALIIGKTAAIGPETWTIEFPAVEAVEAGICQIVKSDELAAWLQQEPSIEPEKIDAFLELYGNSATKTVETLKDWMGADILP